MLLLLLLGRKRGESLKRCSLGTRAPADDGPERRSRTTTTRRRPPGPLSLSTGPLSYFCMFYKLYGRAGGPRRRLGWEKWQAHTTQANGFRRKMLLSVCSFHFASCTHRTKPQPASANEGKPSRDECVLASCAKKKAKIFCFFPFTFVLSSFFLSFSFCRLDFGHAD